MTGPPFMVPVTVVVLMPVGSMTVFVFITEPYVVLSFDASR